MEGRSSEDGVVVESLRNVSRARVNESSSFLRSLKMFSVFNTELYYNHGKRDAAF